MTNHTKQVRNAGFAMAAVGILAAELPRVADSRTPIFAISSGVPPAELPHHVPEQDFPTIPAVAQAVVTSSATVSITPDLNGLLEGFKTT